MRRWLSLTAVLFGGACVSLAQTAPAEAGAKAEGAAPAAAEAETEELRVKERLQEEAARRRKEKAELLEKLAKAEMDLKVSQARQADLQKETTYLDRDVAAAQQRSADAYSALSTVSAEYDRAEKMSRESFLGRILAELQGRYDAEFRRLKAEHERDMAFIEKTKWRPVDFDRLVIPMDKTEKGRQLTLRMKDGNAAAGEFPTMDFATGKKVWHAVPTGATFTAYIQRENPFVTDVVLSLGGDYMGSGSTNRLDWDVHVYLAKDFMKGEGDPDRFRLVGVSWPVDLAHRLCWQADTAPVFEPTAMPPEKKATPETGEIAAQTQEWKFADEGLIKKRQDAINTSKNLKLLVEKLQQAKPGKEQRYQRRLEELRDKEKELTKKVDDLKAMLAEYEDDVRTSPPPDLPAPAAGTNVTEGLN